MFEQVVNQGSPNCKRKAANKKAKKLFAMPAAVGGDVFHQILSGSADVPHRPLILMVAYGMYVGVSLDASSFSWDATTKASIRLLSSDLKICFAQSSLSCARLGDHGRDSILPMEDHQL